MGAINSNVMGALRGWLTTEAKALLETMPEEERGTSVLMENVAQMLTDGGRLAEAEVLQREVLAAWRAKLGQRHPGTLAALNNLAVNLYQQRKHAEAAPLFQQAYDGRCECLGEGHPSTLHTLGELGASKLASGRVPVSYTHLTLPTICSL